MSSLSSPRSRDIAATLLVLVVGLNDLLLIAAIVERLLWNPEMFCFFVPSQFWMSRLDFDLYLYGKVC